MEIVEVKVQPRGTDPTGALVGGFLKVFVQPEKARPVSRSASIETKGSYRLMIEEHAITDVRMYPDHVRMGLDGQSSEVLFFPLHSSVWRGNWSVACISVEPVVEKSNG